MGVTHLSWFELYPLSHVWVLLQVEMLWYVLGNETKVPYFNVLSLMKRQFLWLQVTWRYTQQDAGVLFNATLTLCSNAEIHFYWMNFHSNHCIYIFDFMEIEFFTWKWFCTPYTLILLFPIKLSLVTLIWWHHTLWTKNYSSKSCTCIYSKYISFLFLFPISVGIVCLGGRCLPSNVSGHEVKWSIIK